MVSKQSSKIPPKAPVPIKSHGQPVATGRTLKPVKGGPSHSATPKALGFAMTTGHAHKTSQGTGRVIPNGVVESSSCSSDDDEEEEGDSDSSVEID